MLKNSDVHIILTNTVITLGLTFFCRLKIYDYVQRETVKQKKNTEQQTLKHVIMIKLTKPIYPFGLFCLNTILNFIRDKVRTIKFSLPLNYIGSRKYVS